VRLPDLPDGEIDPVAVAAAITAALRRLQVPESADVAVAVKWAGRSLGWLLATEIGHPVPVVSIDGVRLSDFDFIDIGGLQPKSGTVPVSIKTMLYHL